jgi:hypothetical protein
VAERDGLALEIITQGPVAQHLEKRQMNRVANLVYITRANAFLTINQALSQRMGLAKKVRNQRMHPRGGKKNGRVVLWNQRSAPQYGVALALEKRYILASQFVSGHFNTSENNSDNSGQHHCESRNLRPKPHLSRTRGAAFERKTPNYRLPYRLLTIYSRSIYVFRNDNEEMKICAR